MPARTQTGTALDAILAYKAGEVRAARAATPLAELEARAANAPPPRGFAAALGEVARSGDNALICELKRRSPSAGDILAGADPVAIARDYAAGGAACLSILTDGPSFGGHLTDLAAVRRAVSLPLLRKDFMIDPWQVAEARAHGADAILVIMAAVDDTLAGELCAAAADHAMSGVSTVTGAWARSSIMAGPPHCSPSGRRAPGGPRSPRSPWCRRIRAWCASWSGTARPSSRASRPVDPRPRAAQTLPQPAPYDSS